MRPAETDNEQVCLSRSVLLDPHVLAVAQAQ